jgi:hypothetical protein
MAANSGALKEALWAVPKELMKVAMSVGLKASLLAVSLAA